MSQTYVYIHLEEGPVPVGLLETAGTGREGVTRFRYGRRYLQRKDRLAIDPVQLPLPEANSERDYVTGEGFALFNGIRDAAPDRWGRHLMDRAASGRVLSEFDYLVATGDDRSGALAFGPDLKGPRRVVPWEQKDMKDESPSLSDLLKAVQVLDKGGKFPEKHRHFLEGGSSLGGARPKATMMIDARQWIAKFSRADDHYPVARAEYAAMSLTASLGLNVPKLRIQKVLKQDIYLIERFDRMAVKTKSKISGMRRLPFISGLTLTGAHESEASRQSYRGLADQLRVYGSQPFDDARELWKRMVFNILCGNTDDHLRNHGFLWDGKGWRLSPAYDIVPLPQTGMERFLAIGVGREGRKATLTNAISDAAAFGYRPDEAHKIAVTMQQKVKRNWETHFRKSGLTTSDIVRLRTCFLACDETIGAGE